MENACGCAVRPPLDVNVHERQASPDRSGLSPFHALAGLVIAAHDSVFSRTCGKFWLDVGLSPLFEALGLRMSGNNYKAFLSALYSGIHHSDMAVLLGGSRQG